MANSDPPAKAIVTVSEMASMVGLSRARFYQLIKEGIFPEPSRKPTTNRPFYDQAQQQECLSTRKTNRGVNGKAILFYRGQKLDPLVGRRGRRSAMTRRRPARRPQNPGTGAIRDPLIAELRHGLGQLGLTGMTDAAIRAALVDEYPDGYAEIDPADLLASLFRRLNRQDSQGNVAG